MRSYIGVPYAAPPVGDLRWRPPQSPQRWTKTFDATQYGSSCPQNADLGAFASAGGDEDCLYLNVYAPDDRSSSSGPLPVFVWIHGGNLTVGQGADYNPRDLVLNGKVIVVTLNYRLGALGFFSQPNIDNEGHTFGNYGQMDQTFALDWVQRNIAALGGDPKNVTIAGESSGGTSVLAQITSPLAAGKFQHAIIMSGGAEIIRHPFFGASRPVEYARKLGTDFTTAAGCGDLSAACLRKLSAKQVLALQNPFIVNQTIIDGTFMPMHPGDALRTGKFNDVTMVNGTTRDEGTFFAALPENATGKAMTAEGFTAGLMAWFGEKTATVASEYPLSNYGSPSEAYAAVATDYLFSCAAMNINKWASQKTSVHAYEFADRTAPSYIPPTSFPLGAAHTFELAYIFPGFHGGSLGSKVELNTSQQRLSAEMVRFWTTTSKSVSWTDWPAYKPEQANVLQLSLPSPQVIDGVGFERYHHCAFWNSLGVY